MTNNEDILNEIKTVIRKEIPDSKIFLFGSRANNTYNEESDWDILVLTQKKYSKEIKWKIHDNLFPLSMSMATFIDLKLIEENEWNNHPGYYALKLDISKHNSFAL